MTLHQSGTHIRKQVNVEHCGVGVSNVATSRQKHGNSCVQSLNGPPFSLPLSVSLKHALTAGYMKEMEYGVDKRHVVSVKIRLIS